MEKTQIPVTNDYIFKRIFTKEGNENILKDLLIAILDDKTIVNIEMQVVNYHDIIERTMFY